MDRNRWIIFALLCIGLTVGLVLTSTKDKVDVSNIDGTKIDTTSVIADHVTGKADAKVVVIEYADFQCPGCYAAYPQYKAVSEQYKGSVAFVFRNFPLSSAHPNALAAASAAEAAGLQGKYWEMHDLVFQNQPDWKSALADQRDAKFEALASQLGLNIDQFRTDIAGSKVSIKINTDRALGLKMNVDSTPTLFINGSKASDEIVRDLMSGTGDKLRDRLDSLLKEAGDTPPSRTTVQ
ncbi:MAG: thioredoxin domain-containing protein [Candidatus Saccharimonadales bacterium]